MEVGSREPQLHQQAGKLGMATNSDVRQVDHATIGEPQILGARQLLDVANAITLTGLAAALACAFLAVSGQTAYAVVALMVSGVCDLFDGVVARRLNRSEKQKAFGGNLDSVVDACSFGFAPVVLMYATGFNGPIAVALLTLFAICVVWRLAYFDTVGLTTVGSAQYFSGLPVTYVATFLPLAFLAGFAGGNWFQGCVGVAVVGLSLAMISSIPIRKPSGIFYILFPLAGIVLATVMVTFADHYMR